MYRQTDKNVPRLQYRFKNDTDLLECRLYFQGKYRDTPLFSISREHWKPYQEEFEYDVRHGKAFSMLKEYLAKRAAQLVKDKDADPTKTLVKEIKEILPDRSFRNLETFAFGKSEYFKGESLAIYEKLFREGTGLKEEDYDFAADGPEIIFYAGEDEYTMRSDRSLTKNILKACEDMDPTYIESTLPWIWDEIAIDPGVELEQLVPTIIRTWKACKRKKFVTGDADSLLDYLQNINCERPIEEAECNNLFGVIVLAYLQCYNADACVKEYVDYLHEESNIKVISYHNVDYILETIQEI